jgi:hypothetical protein
MASRVECARGTLRCRGRFARSAIVGRKSSPDPQTMPQQHSRLHWAGVIILVTGWLAAALIYFVAGSDGDAQAGDYQLINGQVYTTPMGSSKREQQQLARLGGSASVRIVEFDSWLGSLWHGQRLAWTLALMSTAVGGLCIYLADLAAEDVGD